MTTAAIYTRISRDLTGEGAGVERQETECRALAARLGFAVGRVYSDNDTSATTGVRRPAFEALLADKPEAVLCWSQDRLLRLSADLEKVLDVGLRIYPVVSGALDLSSDTGQAVARTVAAWSTFEVRQKAARQRAANRQRAAQGRPHWGRPPFGWKQDGTLVPEQAEAIRAAYREVVDGQANMAQVARTWNASGFRTVQGTEWDGGSARRHLLSVRNVGEVVYRGRPTGVKGTWAPVIDEATFLAAKAVLTNPTRGAGGHPRSHEWSGLMSCGQCGRPMRAFWRKRKSGIRLTWRCSGMCLAALDEVVRPLVEAVVVPAAIEEGSRSPNTGDSVSPDPGPLMARREVLLERLDSLADALAGDRLTLSQVERASAATRAEITSIEEELAKPQQPTPRFRTIGEIEAFAMSRHNLAANWDIRVNTVGAAERVTIRRRSRG